MGLYTRDEALAFAKTLHGCFVRMEHGADLSLVTLSMTSPKRLVPDIVIKSFRLSFASEHITRPKKEFVRLLMLPKDELEALEEKEQYKKATVPKLKLGKDKAQEEDELQQKFDAVRKLPPILGEELATIAWEGIGHVIHLAGGTGSSGVYLLQVNDKLVTLKPQSLSTPSEYFCAIMFSYFGVKTPKHRVLLSKDNGEYERLITSLRASPIPAIEEAKLRLLLDLEKNSCCAIAEYIPSKELNKIFSVGGVDRQRLCYQIGQTIVLDMLCNNGDRVPFLHRGDGNASNLLICPNEDYEELFDICLIDNTTTCIKAERGRKRYMDLVEKVSKEIFVGNLPAPKIHHMENVARFLLLFADFETDFDDATAIKEGMQKMMTDVVFECSTNTNLFHEMKAETVRQFIRAGQNEPILKAGLDLIDPTFLNEVQIRFR